MSSNINYTFAKYSMLRNEGKKNKTKDQKNSSDYSSFPAKLLFTAYCKIWQENIVVVTSCIPNCFQQKSVKWRSLKSSSFPLDSISLGIRSTSNFSKHHSVWIRTNSVPKDSRVGAVINLLLFWNFFYWRKEPTFKIRLISSFESEQRSVLQHQNMHTADMCT